MKSQWYMLLQVCSYEKVSVVSHEPMVLRYLFDMIESQL